MSIIQRTNTVIDVTQSQLDQIIGALCALNIIEGGGLESGKHAIFVFFIFV
jgi:hypothetical protein